MTHSGDVSSLEPTTFMVLRSQTRGGRGSAAILEIETRQEPEMDNPVEIEVSVSTIYVKVISAPLKNRQK